MARKHWLDEIAADVRQRAYDAVDTVAAGLRDSVPFGGPPPAPPTLTLEQYLGADPHARQALLLGTGDPAGTIAKLHSDAVSRYGALAAPILPILSMEDAQQGISQAQQNFDPQTDVAAAHAQLQDLLGYDPFSQASSSS